MSIIEESGARFGLGIVGSMIINATMDSMRAVEEAERCNDIDSATKCIEAFYEFMIGVLPSAIHWRKVLKEDTTEEETMLNRMKLHLKEYHDGLANLSGGYTFEEILKKTGVKTDGE
jgi:hypothetical protein